MNKLLIKIISRKKPICEKKSLLYQCPYCKSPIDFLHNHQCKIKAELKKPIWKNPNSRRKNKSKGRPPYKLGVVI